MEQANTTLLILHDTTELNFTSHYALEGTGPVGNAAKAGDSCSTTAWRRSRPTTRKILGLAFQQVAHARHIPKSETHTPRQRRARESDVWERGIRGVGTAPDRACWIDVADRGSDSFEVMKASWTRATSSSSAPARTARSRLARRPRVRLGCSSLGSGRYRRSSPRGEVIIPGQGGRPERTARVEMAAAPVWFLVPKLVHGVHPDWVPMRVWVERIWESHPPADVEEPLEWILLSSLPASGPQELARHRDW